MNDKAHFDLFLYMKDELTSFTADLFRAMLHADNFNFNKLQSVFPDEAQAVSDYCRGDTNSLEEFRIKYCNPGPVPVGCKITVVK